MNPSNKNSFKNHLTNRKGFASWVELLAIIPVMTAIMMIAAEMTSYVTNSQKICTISKIATDSVYRNCGSQSIVVDNRSGFAPMDSCANSTIDSIREATNDVIRNFATTGTIIVSVFQVDSNNPNALGNQDDDDDGGNSVNKRYFLAERSNSVALISQPTASRIDRKDKHLLYMVNGKRDRVRQNLIVVAEVIHPYTPLFPGVGSLLQMTTTGIPEELYDFTIY